MSRAGAVGRSRLAAGIGLGLLLALSAALRVVGLGRLSFSGNEDYTVLAARGILEHGLPWMPSGLLYPRGLPYSYAVAGCVALAGESEFVVRLLAALCSVGTVAVVWCLGRRWCGPAVGWIAGVVVAGSDWELQVARSARMYAPLELAFVLTVYLVGRVVLDGRQRLALPSLACGALTCSLHQLGTTVLLPALALVRGGPCWRTNRRYLAAFAATVAATGTLVIAFEAYHYDRWAARARATTSTAISFVEADDAGPPAGSGAPGSADSKPAGKHAPPAGLSGRILVALLLGGVGAWSARRLARGEWWESAVTLVVGAAAGLGFPLLAAYGLFAWLVARTLCGRPLRRSTAIVQWLLIACAALGWVAWAGLARGVGVVPALRGVLGYPPNFLEFYVRKFPWMFAAATIAAFFVGFRRSARPGSLLYLAAAFVLPLTLLGLHPLASSRFYERYAQHVAPAFFVLYAAAVAWIARALAGALARAGFRFRRLWEAALIVALLLASRGLAPDRSWAALNMRHGVNPGLRDIYGAAYFHPDHRGPSRRACESARGEPIVVMDILMHRVYCGYGKVQWTRGAKHDAEGWIGGSTLTTTEELKRFLQRSEAPHVWFVSSGAELYRLRTDEELLKLRNLLESACVERVWLGSDGLSALYRMDVSCLRSPAQP